MSTIFENPADPSRAPELKGRSWQDGFVLGSRAVKVQTPLFHRSLALHSAVFVFECSPCLLWHSLLTHVDTLC